MSPFNLMDRPVVFVMLAAWVGHLLTVAVPAPETTTATTKLSEVQFQAESGAKNNSTLSAANLVQQHGFIAEEHHLNAADGHILNVVRVLNPLINGGKRGLANKRPLLFVPGEMATAATFIVNSIDTIEPKDFTDRFDTNRMSVESLIEALKGEPAARSLVYLASSFGHECWLLNRRGTPESLAHIAWSAYKEQPPQKLGNQTTTSNNNDDDPVDELEKILREYERTQVNSLYWNFSLDEQAKYDLPKAIDYILSATWSDKLALVGHSTGSALSMMMFILWPDMEQKASAPRVQSLVLRACQEKFSEAACNVEESQATGRIGNEESTQVLDLLSTQTGKPVSSMQSLQLVQNRDKGKMYYYDYGNETRNSILYGQTEPPVYDVSRINSTSMSFWHGSFDLTATPEDVWRLIADLKDRR